MKFGANIFVVVLVGEAASPAVIGQRWRDDQGQCQRKRRKLPDRAIERRPSAEAGGQLLHHLLRAAAARRRSRDTKGGCADPLKW